jgi:hypothetical protein
MYLRMQNFIQESPSRWNAAASRLNDQIDHQNARKGWRMEKCLRYAMYPKAGFTE